MYLLSWTEEEAKVEASLGGRITVEEMAVLYEEIRELVATIERQPFLLLIDYSKAKNFDAMTHMVLEELKDFVLANGALKIATVLRDEDDVMLHTNARLQLVMEGREEFVLEPNEVKWTTPAPVRRHGRRVA